MTADASSIDTVAKLGSQDNVGVDGSTADSSPNASTKAAACSTPTPTTTANKSSSTDATKSINRNTSTTPAQNNNPLPSVVEFEPPLACVRRILKNTLPSSTNVGKDASAAFSRACGIFIIYLTACANDFARENKRQTITANDVLAAVAVCIVFVVASSGLCPRVHLYHRIISHRKPDHSF